MWKHHYIEGRTQVMSEEKNIIEIKGVALKLSQ